MVKHEITLYMSDVKSYLLNIPYMVEDGMIVIMTNIKVRIKICALGKLDSDLD